MSRRGLVLSAAFLMTALSRGRVFAEVVPSELVQRTVRSALTPGSVLVPPESLGAEGPPGVDLAASPKPTSSFAPRSSPIYRLALMVSLFLLFTLSVAIGGSLAMVASGGSFSDFFALLPAQFSPRIGHSHCQ